MSDKLIHEYTLASIQQLERVEAKLLKADIDLSELDYKAASVNCDPINPVDYVFTIGSGMLGGIISSSEAITKVLDKVHTDASTSNPNTFLGKVFKHKYDNNDTVLSDDGVRQFLKRDGDKGAAHLHRLFYGHDPFSIGSDNPFYVLAKQHGLVRGIAQAARHLIGDTFSKGGVPLPFSSWFDYFDKGGNICNWFDTVTKKVTEGAGSDLKNQQVFRRLFTINMQDILAQGLTWGLMKAFLAVRNINNNVYESQLKLIAYSSNFFTNFAIGWARYNIPYVSWPSLSMTIKEFFIFLRRNYKDIKELETITDKIVSDNDALERRIFDLGKILPTSDKQQNYIKKLDDDYRAFERLIS